MKQNALLSRAFISEHYQPFFRYKTYISEQEVIIDTKNFHHNHNHHQYRPMVRTSINLFALLRFAIGAGAVYVDAASITRDNGCKTLSYGPFRLYASPVETSGELHSLKLIREPMPNPGIVVNSVLSVSLHTLF